MTSLKRLDDRIVSDVKVEDVVVVLENGSSTDILNDVNSFLSNRPHPAFQRSLDERN